SSLCITVWHQENAKLPAQILGQCVLFRLAILSEFGKKMALGDSPSAYRAISLRFRLGSQSVADRSGVARQWSAGVNSSS
ncbi:MAG: hypothetical protein AAF539_09030, partial [Planctomycetota bacterium]